MPTLMTQNTINALKGWPQERPVDYSGVFASSVTSTVPAGSVVHLNSDGEFELGVGTENVMPMFTFFASDSPHVKNDGGDPDTDKNVWVPVQPNGKVLALVAIGAYELVSTQFVAGSYPPNTLLTSAASGGNAGKLSAGTLGTHMICGQVSRGVVNNNYGYDALAFWPVVAYVYP